MSKRAWAVVAMGIVTATVVFGIGSIGGASATPNPPGDNGSSPRIPRR
jgi:hypothetical protein